MKCPNTEFFLVCIFPYSVQILENKDQKNSVFGHFSRSESVWSGIYPNMELSTVVWWRFVIAKWFYCFMEVVFVDWFHCLMEVALMGWFHCSIILPQILTSAPSIPTFATTARAQTSLEVLCASVTRALNRMLQTNLVKVRQTCE